MSGSARCLFLAAGMTLVLRACGGGHSEVRFAPREAAPTVRSNDYVASPTLSRGDAERLFVVPSLGTFRATCRRPGQARISYTAGRGTATQLVSAVPTRGSPLNGWLDPGERLMATVGRRAGPRVDWQVGLLSEGRIAVLTGSFAVGGFPKFGCFVTGKAQVANRAR